MSDLNDPRVLFAAERTLLAWNRTALTLMGSGFVIERRLHPGLWINAIVALLGIALTVYLHAGQGL